MLPLRQKTEFGTLREVVLGRTDHAAFPPKSKANANFTDHIADLGPAFYDRFEDGEQIPIADIKPELVEAYDTLHDDAASSRCRWKWNSVPGTAARFVAQRWS